MGLPRRIPKNDPSERPTGDDVVYWGPATSGLSAADTNAAISRERYEDYNKRFRPIEQEYLDYINDDGRVKREVDSGVAQVDKSYGVAKGVAGRTLTRFGTNTSVTPDQRAAMDKLQSFNKTKTKSAVADNVREAAYESRLSALNAMSGFGRGLVADAGDSAYQAASMQSTREQGNRISAEQARQQDNAMAMTTIMTIAMIAMSSRDYKENIEDVDSEYLLEKVKAMRVVEYDYKDDFKGADGHCVGLIAEETDPLFHAENGKAVNIYSLVGALIGANQALAKRIEVLEASKHG